MSVLRFIWFGILILVVIGFGAGIGYLADRSPGYVMAAYDGMTVETSLWFAIGALFVAYILLRITEYLLSRLLSSTGRFGRWNSGRRARKAATRTTQGLLLMAEGQWSDARRTLVAAAPNALSPLTNYITAARAAARLGDKAHRDELLDSALESTPGSQLAVGLARVEMQQEAGEFQASLQQLEQLREQEPRHPVVQRLYVNAMDHLERLPELVPSLSNIKKSKALAKDELASLETRVAAAAVNASTDAASLQQAYSKLPKAQRSAPMVASAAAHKALALTVQDQPDAAAMQVAEKALSTAIDAHANGAESASLFDLYGRLDGEIKARQSLLQKWMKKLPQHGAIALAAARVAAADGDVDAALVHAGKALELQPDSDVYLEMAHLCCAQGDAAQALTYLEQAYPQMPTLTPVVAQVPVAPESEAAAETEAETEATAAPTADVDKNAASAA